MSDDPLSPPVRADLANPRAARAFADFMTAQGVAVRVIDGEGISSVLLEDAGARERFAEEFERFVADPGHARYLAASWQTGRPEAGAGASLGAWYRRRGTPLRRLRTGPVTATVAVVCVAVFLLMSLDDAFGLWQHLRFFGSLQALWSGQELWRWLTPSFVHMGLMHIGFNLLWWYELGSVVERSQGSLRLAGLFVVLNIISNLAQFLMSGANFGGLSGVVYGLLGYLWAFGRCCPGFPGQINPFIMRFMVGWLLVCMTGIVGPIANAAHVGGLMAGLVLGVVWGVADRRRWS